MRHRVECDPEDDGPCPCRCHERCGALTAYRTEPCYRRPGHRHEHQTRMSVEHRRRMERIAA